MSDENTGNDVAVIDREIREITALAHTGRSADETKYEELQPRLRELVAAKAGSARAAPATAPQRSNVPQPPASIMAYPSLPESPAFSASDHRDWNAALPELLRLGLTTDQVFGLAQLMARTAAKAQAEHDAERGAAHAQTQRRTGEILARRFGTNWRQRAENAQAHLRSALHHDAGTRIGQWELANGERLGDRPEFVSMIIELAEGR